MPGIVRKEAIKPHKVAVFNEDEHLIPVVNPNATPLMAPIPPPNVLKPITNNNNPFAPTFHDAHVFTEENSLIITDRNVVSFFQSNPNLNVETILLGVIKILKDINISSEKDEHILNLMKDSFSQLNTTLKDTMYQNNTTRSFLSESINQSKQLLAENVENSKLVITEHLTNIITQNSTKIQDEVNKNSLSVNSINSQLQGQIKTQVQEICEKEIQRQNSLLTQNINNSLNENISKIMSELNKSYNCIDNIQFQLQNQIRQHIKDACEFELEKQKAHLTDLFHKNSGNPINMNSPQEMELIKNKIIDSLSSFSSKISSPESISHVINSNLHSFSSDIASNISELSSLLKSPKIENTELLLNQTMPTSSITKIEVNKFIVEHETHGNIYVVDKNSHFNIPLKEVDKFSKECTSQGCHGIFISQKSGICEKETLSVQFNNGKVLLFVSNMDYNTTILEECMSLIDSLTPYAESVCKTNNKEDIHYIIQTIVSDYNDVKAKHNVVINNLEQQINTLKSCDIPSLHKYIKSEMPPTVEYEEDAIQDDTEDAIVEDATEVVPPPPPEEEVQKKKRKSKKNVTFEV